MIPSHERAEVAVGAALDGWTPDRLGPRLRERRELLSIGLRELSRRVGVSASLISQVELGRATPSVGTLYAIVSELRMSLDELFLDGRDLPLPAHPAARPGEQLPVAPAPAGSCVVRAGDGASIQLDSGVTWQRLTPTAEEELDFLRVRYDAGSASCAPRSLIGHPGREYGCVLAGCLSVTVAAETFELGPGDSISFDSTTPHRLFNAGDSAVEAIWVVIGRHAAIRNGAP